ncbi:hypothetical protein [Ekhidna sp. To15]|uniref:hypothetical protein n=1 Tax=Ekhidna sp. To15 TaxID=3395267 RepID=UPI003F51B5EE
MRHLLSFSILFLSLAAGAQSNLEKGKKYFERRSEKSKGLIARKGNINKCIRILNAEKDNPEAIMLLLRAYEFKGSYTKISKKKKQQLYKKAVDLGSQKIKDYPDNAGILFYYSANLGRWGQEISILKAHNEGITDEIRETLKKVDLLDSTFAEAGAKRLLGGMHLKIPKIPFVMTWPSKETSLVLLEKAYKTSQENLANAKLYGESLIKNNYEDEGKTLLRQVVSKEPRPHMYLEDKRVIEETKKILN